MILIALGANLPSPAGLPDETLHAALRALAQRRVAIRAVSPLYRSNAWPDPRDPKFVNAVAKVETELSPYDLLALLRETEQAFGRTCARQNAPRSLDLDILDYNGRIERGPPSLPHPRLHERNFVLIPLRDVAPAWIHPASGLDIDTLIQSLPDETRTLTKLEETRARSE